MKIFKCSLLALLLIQLIFVGCFSGSDNNKHEITIKGNVERKSDDKIYLYSYKDSVDFFISQKSILDSSLIDSNGDFNFYIKSRNPLVFNIQYGSSDLVSNMIVLPGDQLTFRFQGDHNDPAVVSEGEASSFNSYLLQFIHKFYKEEAIKKEYYIASNYMDIKTYEGYLDKRQQQMLNNYAVFSNGVVLKKEYHDYAVNTIKYEIASDKLMYLWKKRMKGEPVYPDSGYFAFATPEFVENVDAFITPSYIRFLNLYFKEIYGQKVESGELPEDKSKSLIPSPEKYKLANKMFTGRFLQALLYNILLDDANGSEGANTKYYMGKNLDSLLYLFKEKYGAAIISN